MLWGLRFKKSRYSPQKEAKPSETMCTPSETLWNHEPQ